MKMPTALINNPHFTNFDFTYEGNLNLLSSPVKIAVVGSRYITVSEAEVAKDIVYSLLNKDDVVIVTGGAIGIDTVAIDICVDNDKPCIVVLPIPLDSRMNTRTRNICNKVVENKGLVVSQFKPNSTVYKTNFLERNRTIALYSDTVLAIAFSPQSGTSSTVNHANTMKDKPVVVVSKIQSNESYPFEVVGALWAIKEGKAIDISEIPETANTALSALRTAWIYRCSAKQIPA